jgi:tungstate transport system permease protein
MTVMNDVSSSFGIAFGLIGNGDGELWRIVRLSLEVSVTSTILACLVGFPIGAVVGVRPFPGRRVVIVVLNALLGLPSVVVGLVIYLLLSRAGPLGSFGILFTPSAIVVAQTVLVVPFVTALTRQFVADGWLEYRETLLSLSFSLLRAVTTLLWDLRYSLITVALAAFGRAASEVGAVMVVGGNIDGVTRVMTTAIALETSKGDLPLALGLGIILLGLVLVINAFAYVVREWSIVRYG